MSLTPTTYQPPTDPAQRQLLLKRMCVFQVRFNWVSTTRHRTVYYLCCTPEGKVYSEGFASDLGMDPIGFSEVTSTRLLWEYLDAPSPGVASSRGEPYRFESYELWPPGYVDLFGSGYQPPSEADLTKSAQMPDLILEELPAGVTSLQDALVEVNGYVFFPGTDHIYGKRRGLSVENLTSAEAVRLSREGEKLYHVEVWRKPPHSVPSRDQFLQIKRDVGLHLRRG